ncbi:hypothetical protein G7054_g32 [Neopestalotiopsis clavispora]|nr:hypothetical protein G7054_g32 [Neopestalotiopsis clavispora]
MAPVTSSGVVTLRSGVAAAIWSKTAWGVELLASVCARSPPALVRAAVKYDPKGILFGYNNNGAMSSFPPDNTPSEAEQSRLRPLLDARVRGKKFQVLSGGQDKLVPYAKSEPFLDFFKSAAATWYQGGGVSVEDNVYADAGHEFSAPMMKDAVRFIVDAVAGAEKSQVTAAKI